jgi:hypothetical protein
MTLFKVRRSISTLVITALAAAINCGAAETTTTRPPSGKAIQPSSAARPAPSSTKGGVRGPLPDPALLDGSAHAPEKKSEHGMIGEFELPGDDNVRNGKVGGPQNQNPSAGGGAQSNNMPMGMPQGGGGPQGQQSQQGGAQGAPAGGQQQAGGAQGGPQNPNAGGAPIQGAGDPGAQPQGAQVGQISGDAAGQQQGGGAGPGDKPQQVSIGDSAMRIDPAAAAQAGVVGAQQPAGHTQQHEKGTGSGGKGSGGSGSGNRVEKGRVIPADL